MPWTFSLHPQAEAELRRIPAAEQVAMLNAAQKLQALEYRMAMLSRHFRPWLTSGACTVAKTESLRRIRSR